jgi:subtilase family serine protease
MKRSIEFVAVAAVLLLLGFATSTLAQIRVGPSVTPAGIKSGAGTTFVPESSRTKPGDAGVRAHTNFGVFIPDSWKPDEAPPYSGYAFQTPASLACLYALVTVTPGCNPNVVTSNPTGGGNTIAVVDAYDDPWAGPDLAYFSAQFGIPFTPAQFQVVYASGVEPPEDLSGGWEFEESADIEYAHAMAPKATIYLVEAASESYDDLGQAVMVANSLIQCGQTNCPSGGTGVGEVIMSWGGPEFPAETSFDAYFATPGVVYFAASGDTPGVSYPCASPNVVCSGGTTTAYNPSTGNFLYEITWDQAGGGVSDYESKPTYQSSLGHNPTPNRGVPDVAFDSSPSSSYWVWDSFGFQIAAQSAAGWLLGYGTSFSDVAWAGIVNAAGSFAPSSASELTTIYNNRFSATDFRDIIVGNCGPYDGTTTLVNWDFCTGVGTPQGYGGK